MTFSESAEIEEWRDVVGYEGLYQVSSLGRIKSLARTVRTRGNGVKPIPEKIMKLQNRPGGYLGIELYSEQKGLSVLVHPLVCRAFHGEKPTDGHEVAHGNAIRHDNRAENLRWATRKENSADRDMHGNTPRGSVVWNSKLTEETVSEIRDLFRKTDINFQELGRLYGISGTQAGNIIHRKQWRHVA